MHAPYPLVKERPLVHKNAETIHQHSHQMAQFTYKWKAESFVYSCEIKQQLQTISPVALS